MKAALAAAAEHLAGLLPLHLTYSQAHETAIEVCHGQSFPSQFYCHKFLYCCHSYCSRVVENNLKIFNLILSSAVRLIKKLSLTACIFPELYIMEEIT